MKTPEISDLEFIPAEALYVADEGDLARLISNIYLEHNSLGIGELKSIEFRDGDSPLFSVNFPVHGERVFNLSSVKKGLITRVAFAKSFLKQSGNELYGRLIQGGLQFDILSKLRIRCDRALDEYTSSNVLAEQLGQRDLRLLIAWASKPTSRPIESLSDICKIVGDYQTMQLCSARQAEVAVAEHYRSLGRKVEDVSISQLDGVSDDWRDYDLRVEGVPVDVKNARRSFGNPNNYSEQFVKTFKRSREDSQNVLIAGALSDYLRRIDYECNKRSNILLLGEVSISDIKRIDGWLKDHFVDVVDIQNFTERAGFIPGWLFDFSDSYYASWNQVIENIGLLFSDPESLDYLDEALSDPYCGPFLRAAIIAGAVTIDDDSETSDLLYLLGMARKNIGLNRRSIFLSLLLHFLISAKKKQNPQFRRIKRFVFPVIASSPTSSEKVLKEYPLGRYDPAEYIWSLISSFETVYAHAKEVISSMVHFRLSGPNVLRGKLRSGRWLTVLAYCGGWDSAANVKCGNNPLVLGKNRNCNDCSLLICEKCGHCSKNCNTLV